jgi:predicted nucleic acid-binding protein
MRIYLDTSAYAKRFLKEIGSEKIDDVCLNATALGLSVICLPELISALNRRRRDGTLSQKNYQLVKKVLVEEIRDASIINLTDNVISRSVQLLEKNVLRAMDSLHIACALEWNAEVFVSADKRQIEAATQAGLEVIPVD